MCHDEDQRREAKEKLMMDYHGYNTGMWMLLYRMTDGEAKDIVNTAKVNQGFEAWEKLQVFFEPRAKMEEQRVRADLQAMTNKKATNEIFLKATKFYQIYPNI